MLAFSYLIGVETKGSKFEGTQLASARFVYRQSDTFDLLFRSRRNLVRVPVASHRKAQGQTPFSQSESQVRHASRRRGVGLEHVPEQRAEAPELENGDAGQRRHRHRGQSILFREGIGSYKGS